MKFVARFVFVVVASGCGQTGETQLPAPPDLGYSNYCHRLGQDGDLPASPALATNPIDYGRVELHAALGEAQSSACVDVVLADAPDAVAALGAAQVKLDDRPESYAIVKNGDGTLIVGRDAVGALYGAYELAERLRLDGAGILPLAAPITGAPSMSFRGANLFVVLPAENEPQWWFYDTHFWDEYLDLLVRSRMNVLDLHGMYYLKNTLFPNALLYFGSSKSFPQVGAPQPDRDRNLAMLNTVVQMASARGIKVALMSYHAEPALDGSKNDWNMSSDQLKTYTREAVASIARAVPDLWRLGFRIGESGQPAQWYVDSFVAGLKDAGSRAEPYTRTWLTPKDQILELLKGGGHYVVQAKFNGEHLAAPYAIAGGSFLRQMYTSSYSYEDFLQGPAPYDFVFQVRTCSTHRIFRYASHERTRRAMETIGMGMSKGFTMEAAHAYYPQRDFYHSMADKFSEWTFHRDELQYLLFGRLGYDPTTSEAPFRHWVKRHTGNEALWDAMQAASDIVPWIQTANTCGADTRDFAPELELGGSTEFWSRPPGLISDKWACSHFRGPFDDFAVAAPSDAADDLIAGRATTRVSPLDVSRLVIDDAVKARAAASANVDMNNAEARDIVRECQALADLGDYFGHKMRSATALAVYKQTVHPEYLSAARSETQTAATAWVKLVQDTAHIAPFVEWLRMGQLGLSNFHWKFEQPRLAEDTMSISMTEMAMSGMPPSQVALPSPDAFFAADRGAGPGLDAIIIEPPDPSAMAWHVTVKFQQPVAATATVRILWKQFSGLADWQGVAASTNDHGASYFIDVMGGGEGGMFAAEVSGPDGAWRYPDVKRATPYVFLAPTMP